MPHKTQHHHHKHLTLQTTIVIILSGLGLNLYWQTYGINTPTIIAGFSAVIISLFLFAIPTIKYKNEATYETQLETTEEAYQQLTNINDPFYKEKIKNNNAHFEELTETKIEAKKPFFYTKFGVELQIEKENTVENKSITYNIQINQEKVMKGKITIFKQKGKVYIREEEETLQRMPVLGTMLSRTKTTRMMERTAQRKNYTITKLKFAPYIRKK